MNFGQRIRDLRRLHRMTQRELAEKVQKNGLRADFTYISKIENNRVETPPSEELIRGLAEILETNPEELLDLAGQFDQRALQQAVSETPEMGVLLRRLQARKIPKEKIQQILDETERANDNED